MSTFFRGLSIEVPTKFRFIGEMEKNAHNTSVNQKRKKLLKKTKTELIDDAVHHISDRSKIFLQQHDFYKTLYSTKNLDCNDESFFNHNIKLQEEQKYLCEGNITFKECTQSLLLMTNGKRPGSDGWTVDFYKIKLRRYWYIALQVIIFSL